VETYVERVLETGDPMAERLAEVMLHPPSRAEATAHPENSSRGEDRPGAVSL
jgi:hypothetical protein